MRAVYVHAFAPFETVGVEEVPDARPGPGEIVVDVVAAEVNYPDMLVIAGQYQFKPPLPFSPGKAAAGRVSAPVMKGKVQAADRDALLAHIRPVTTLAELAPATLVIEAIIEDLSAKQDILRKVEEVGA